MRGGDGCMNPADGASQDSHESPDRRPLGSPGTRWSRSSQSSMSPDASHRPQLSESIHSSQSSRDTLHNLSTLVWEETPKGERTRPLLPGSARWLRYRNDALENERQSLLSSTLEMQVASSQPCVVLTSPLVRVGHIFTSSLCGAGLSRTRQAQGTKCASLFRPHHARGQIEQRGAARSREHSGRKGRTHQKDDHHFATGLFHGKGLSLSLSLTHTQCLSLDLYFSFVQKRQNTNACARARTHTRTGQALGQQHHVKKH